MNMVSRPGLSFELAPAPAAHPLRTDIALFVGTVARRPVAWPEAKPLLPPVLQHWLHAQGVPNLRGLPLHQRNQPLHQSVHRVRHHVPSKRTYHAHPSQECAPVSTVRPRLARTRWTSKTAVSPRSASERG